MRKLLVTTVCALLALPVAAIADDDDRPSQAHYYGHVPSQGGERHYDHDGGDHDGGNRSYGYGGNHSNGYGGNHSYGYGGTRYYGYGGAPQYYASSPQYYASAPHYYAGAPRNYGYAGAPNYYYGGGHHHDNDDALWAIGGLVLGAVIGHAIEHSAATASAPASSAPHHTQQCQDTVAYDSDGAPYVKRDCR